MKNYFPMLLLGALVLTTTSCKKETDTPTQNQQYEITVTTVSGGYCETTVDGAAASKAPKGAEVTLTATPDQGYTFSHWTVKSGGITLSGNPATFTMPAENISVRAEFTEEVEEIVNVFDKIPDPEFLFYCREIAKFDTDNDGVLTVEEARTVTEINVNEWYKLTGVRIGSLAGIEYFTSLTVLTCYGNALTGIDVSKNTELTYLHTGTNWMSSIDITKNTKLVELYVSRNAITEIDLSKCPDLEKFECNGCSELTSLNVSGTPKLTEISVANCPKITSLDFSNNPALESVICYEGKLSSLNLSNCAALKAVNCIKNELTSLDVSKCTALTELICSNNQLGSLDVSKSPSLSYLMCYNNRMTALDATTMSNPTNFDLGCGLQTTDGTTPQALTLTLREEQKPHWQYFMESWVEINANVKLTGERADIFVAITDPAFKAHCEQFDTNRDGKLSQEEAAVPTVIKVANMGIASLAGLEYFTGITKLVCDKNKLTSLCVAYNPNLVELVCTDNQLTELILTEGLSGGEALITLSCQNNRLSKLSVGGCKQLQTLNCQNNQLTELNMSFSRSLTMINCSNNKLTSLDFYRVSGLVSLICSNNELTSLNVARKSALMSLMCNNNPMTSLDISGCTSLIGVMAYENRLSALNASEMGSPNGYNLFCGNQTSDGSTAQTLTLTLRAEQKPYWESTMKSSSMNANIVLAE